jgi:hypothetical protein
LILLISASQVAGITGMSQAILNILKELKDRIEILGKEL